MRQTRDIVKKIPQIKYIAAWCFLGGVASTVVGAKRTEEHCFKNELGSGLWRGLLNMGDDTFQIQIQIVLFNIIVHNVHNIQ